MRTLGKAFGISKLNIFNTDQRGSIHKRRVDPDSSRDGDTGQYGWMAVAGFKIMSSLIAPTLAREKGWFESEGLTDYEFIATGIDEPTLFEMNPGQIYFGLDLSPPW